MSIEHVAACAAGLGSFLYFYVGNEQDLIPSSVVALGSSVCSYLAVQNYTLAVPLIVASVYMIKSEFLDEFGLALFPCT